jgi:hypothetical protein
MKIRSKREPSPFIGLLEKLSGHPSGHVVATRPVRDGGVPETEAWPRRQTCSAAFLQYARRMNRPHQLAS